jgi:hypothetical protein
VEQLAAQGRRPGDFLGRELEPLLDVPDDVVLQPVAVLFEHAAKARDIAHRAQRLEGLGGAGEVRLGFLDHAAEVLEDFLLRFQHGAHARVHRQAAEVAAPGHSRATKVAVEALGEAGTRLGNRDRRAQVGAGDHAQQ